MKWRIKEIIEEDNTNTALEQRDKVPNAKRHSEEWEIARRSEKDIQTHSETNIQRTRMLEPIESQNYLALKRPSRSSSATINCQVHH